MFSEVTANGIKDFLSMFFWPCGAFYHLTDGGKWSEGCWRFEGSSVITLFDLFTYLSRKYGYFVMCFFAHVSLSCHVIEDISCTGSCGKIF